MKSKKKNKQVIDPFAKSLFTSQTIIQGHLMFTGSCDKDFIKSASRHLRGISFNELKNVLIDQKEKPLVEIGELRGKLFIKFTSNIPLTYFPNLVPIKEMKKMNALNAAIKEKKKPVAELNKEVKPIRQHKPKKKPNLVPQRIKTKHTITTPNMETKEQVQKRYEERQRILHLREIENEKALKSKGIYLTNPNAFKRCENCANFTSMEKCSHYSLKVSENHRCRRFYSFKTLLGGGFSPR